MIHSGASAPHAAHVHSIGGNTAAHSSPAAAAHAAATHSSRLEDTHFMPAHSATPAPARKAIPRGQLARALDQDE